MNKYRICPIVGCRGGLSKEKASDERPQFKCTKCGYTFTNGKDGGEYALNVS